MSWPSSTSRAGAIASPEIMAAPILAAGRCGSRTDGNQARPHRGRSNLVLLRRIEAECLAKMGSRLGAAIGQLQNLGEIRFDRSSRVEPVGLLDQLPRRANHCLTCVELAAPSESFSADSAPSELRVEVARVTHDGFSLPACLLRFCEAPLRINGFSQAAQTRPEQCLLRELLERRTRLAKSLLRPSGVTRK